MIKFFDLKSVNEYFVPALSEAIQQVVTSGWYLQGEENRLFEVNLPVTVVVLIVWELATDLMPSPLYSELISRWE